LPTLLGLGEYTEYSSINPCGGLHTEVDFSFGMSAYLHHVGVFQCKLHARSIYDMF
jgi:hypothetical protein